MQHQTTPKFWQRFYALPETVQRQARKSYDLLKADPNHPSLNFKKVGKYWSARIGLSYRALAVEDGSDFIWVELPKFTKELDELETLADKWIYFIKCARGLETIPETMSQVPEIRRAC